MVLGRRRDRGGGVDEYHGRQQGRHDEDRRERRPGGEDRSAEDRAEKAEEVRDGDEQKRREQAAGQGGLPRRGQRPRGHDGGDEESDHEREQIGDEIETTEEILEDEIGEDRRSEEEHLGHDGEPFADDDLGRREMGEAEEIEGVPHPLGRHRSSGADGKNDGRRKAEKRPEEAMEELIDLEARLQAGRSVEDPKRHEEEHRRLEEDERPRKRPRLHPLTQLLDEHRADPGREVVPRPGRRLRRRGGGEAGHVHGRKAPAFASACRFTMSTKASSRRRCSRRNSTTSIPPAISCLSAPASAA